MQQTPSLVLAIDNQRFIKFVGKPRYYTIVNL